MAGFGLKMIARAPGLKRLPLLRLLAIADVVRLAKNHANKLTADDRKRMLALAKKASPTKDHLRGNKLTQAEQDELKALVLKAEPRIFAGETANMLSPIPIPSGSVRAPRTSAPRPPRSSPRSAGYAVTACGTTRCANRLSVRSSEPTAIQ